MPVLLSRCLNHLAEVEQLVEHFAVKEVGQTLTPTVFELNEDLNQLNIIL